MFTDSTLFHKGKEGTLYPSCNKNISGLSVPLVILGDPVYPLLPWLMKPYSNNGHLTSAQKGRIVVEMVDLKEDGVFCLNGLVCLDKTPMIVAACCVLHNKCEVHGVRAGLIILQWILPTQQSCY